MDTHDLIRFRDRQLVFTDNAIRDELGHDVMMDWEHPMMKRHAELICQPGWDVLEFGFGMGISASYIQALGPRTHTIVECHPQVLERAYTWAKDKPNVKIVAGEWWEKRRELGTYDGILYDIYDDPNSDDFYENFRRLLKPGGRMSFYNLEPAPTNRHGVEGCEYHVVEVQPDANDYHNTSKYYVPVWTDRSMEEAKTLQTARLELRPVRVEDVEELWPYVSDPELSRLMTWEPHRDRSETRAFVDYATGARVAGTAYAWTIRQQGRLCGVVGLHEVVRQQRAWRQDRAELGFWCGAPFRGQGFVTEAAAEVVRFAFEELGLHKVKVGCASENGASRKVIERLGFRLVGEERDHFFRHDRWWDHSSYELLVHEWRSRTSP